MSKVYIVDALMGSGKTSAVINMMNNDSDNSYVFITPFLKEVDRIKLSCRNKRFREPINKGDGKLIDLHELFKENINIASTHALFKTYNEDTIKILSKSKYTLILDEVVDVMEHIPLHKDDINKLLSMGMCHVDDDNYVIWDDMEYNGDKFREIKLMAINKTLMLIDNKLMLWCFPIEIFRCFKTIYILTYMFDAQIQKYYYDLNNVKYTNIGVEKINNTYIFSNKNTIPNYVKKLKDKIHIVDDDELNSVGLESKSLSYGWFERHKGGKKDKLKQLKKNIENLYRHKFNSKSRENMWTVFLEFKNKLCGKGYTKGFIVMNVRATNEFRYKKYLAYCINRFLNPYLKNYFIEHNVQVYEDKYALSEMIQWIWRSAIREGKDIHLYIPSLRMRTLLKNWLDELSKLWILIGD
jgi:hypothetical protein